MTDDSLIAAALDRPVAFRRDFLGELGPTDQPHRQRLLRRLADDEYIAGLLDELAHDWTGNKPHRAADQSGVVKAPAVDRPNSTRGRHDLLNWLTLGCAVVAVGILCWTAVKYVKYLHNRCERAEQSAAVAQAIDEHLGRGLLAHAAAGWGNARPGRLQSNASSQAEIERLGRAMVSRYRDQPGILADLHLVIGGIYWDLGLVEQARGQAYCGYMLRLRLFGPADERTIAAATCLRSLRFSENRSLAD